MAIYRYGKPRVTQRGKRVRRIWPFVLGCVVVVILGFAGWWALQRDATTTPSVTSEAVDRGSYDPNQTFETEWFSFIAPKNWIFVTELSSATKFVYRDYSGDDAVGLLTVYVNSQPADNWFTNVVPVALRGENELAADTLSDHCKGAVPDKKNRSPQAVEVNEVKFTCWTDATNLFAVAGQKGGTQALKMTRRDGSSVTYVITYQNIGYTANPGALERVANTFVSR